MRLLDKSSLQKHVGAAICGRPYRFDTTQPAASRSSFFYFTTAGIGSPFHQYN
jgi:hypothetical protein